MVKFKTSNVLITLSVIMAIQFIPLTYEQNFSGFQETWLNTKPVIVKKNTYASGNTWTKLNPSPRPSGRGYFDLTYDNESNVVILMDGFQMLSANPYPVIVHRDDLWAYSISSNTWEDITTSVKPPSRSTRGAMAYDAKHDVVILFGGVGGEGGDELFSDTWAYDYNTNTWTNKTPKHSPPARDAHGMVYDTQSERIIMFGGRNTTKYWDVKENDFSSDTWIYDYGTNTWTNVTPAIRPQGRWFFDMVYDAKADRVILFGGYTNNYLKGGIDRGVKDDTWAFDFESKTWTELNTMNSPSPRSYFSMAYDSKANRTILYGGSFGAGGGDDWDDILLNDTWAFDYNTKAWTEMRPSSSPGRRMRHTVVYNEETSQMVLFGGQLDDEWNSFNNETWIYTYQEYTSQSTTTSGTPLPIIPVVGSISLIALLIIHRRRVQTD